MARSPWSEARSRLLSWIRMFSSREFQSRLDEVASGLGPGEVDPFGLDPSYLRYSMAASTFLAHVYFRAETVGIENIPDGKALLVANHSGQVPLDGIAVVATAFLDRSRPRLVRSMVHKWSPTVPFVSTFFTKSGQVMGLPENARRLLEMGEVLLTFPEGTRGLSKTIQERYQLARFGKGFARLALQTGAPVVPAAIIGAEEQYISVANLTSLAKAVGLPSLPIIPQLLVPGGQLPIPTRYHLRFGEPIVLQGSPEDEEALESQVSIVRAAVHKLLEEGLAVRQGWF
jgi:1-acyl-sn-glycerol-3-phosphate acyltransferase